LRAAKQALRSDEMTRRVLGRDSYISIAVRLKSYLKENLLPRWLTWCLQAGGKLRNPFAQPEEYTTIPFLGTALHAGAATTRNHHDTHSTN
jgi:hypothetical protein